MNNPLVSVIVPIYNVDKYLKKCVESVLAQTYAELEIILVDDGSTDGSSKICDEYIEKDSRILVIHKPNGGLSDARNAGLDKAHGEYLVFIDSDDYIHPDMIKILLQNSIDNNLDVSCCNFYFGTNREDAEFYGTEPDSKCSVYESENRVESLKRIGVAACNKLYKSIIFSDIRYPVGKYHEDEWVIHRVLYETARIGHCEAKLYFYYTREGSITQSFDEKKFFDVLEAYEDRISFSCEHHWEEMLDATVYEYTEYIIRKYKLLAELSKKSAHSRYVGIVNRYPEYLHNKDRELFAKSPKQYYVKAWMMHYVYRVKDVISGKNYSEVSGKFYNIKMYGK